MQARDVMTRDVVTVVSNSLVKRAAEALAEHGFAALPVVDDGRLVGIIAEADVLRDRLPPDPRLHLRRSDPTAQVTPPPLVQGVMTVGVRSVDASADVADVARLFVDEHLRSVPVLEHDRMVGIVSRRDLLRSLGRPDDRIRADLLLIVEDYTGEAGCWDVEVIDGVATIRRTSGAPGEPTGAETRALQELAATVGGVVSLGVLPHDASSPLPSGQSVEPAQESRGTP